MKMLVRVLCLMMAGSGLSSAQEHLARQQPTVPEEYREMPFVETAVEPVLNNVEQERGFILFQRPIMEPVYPNTYPLAHERGCGRC